MTSTTASCDQLASHCHAASIPFHDGSHSLSLCTIAAKSAVKMATQQAQRTSLLMLSRLIHLGVSPTVPTVQLRQQSCSHTSSGLYSSANPDYCHQISTAGQAPVRDWSCYIHSLMRQSWAAPERVARSARWRLSARPTKSRQTPLQSGSLTAPPLHADPPAPRHHPLRCGSVLPAHLHGPVISTGLHH